MNLRRRHAVVWIHDDLTFVAQVDRLKILKLMQTSRNLQKRNLETIQKLFVTQMDEYGTLGIGHGDANVLRIAEINLAQVVGVPCASGIKVSNQVLINLHSRCPRGEWIGVAESQDHREREVRLTRQIHYDT